ncbi:MAG TPA: ElyC/SanA/YdcF family protein [Chitinispirillaceae bacterium]|nr:ElyC/SanA/YdcF family protein [Chitinispirillaceae bacterium]
MATVYTLRKTIKPLLFILIAWIFIFAISHIHFTVLTPLRSNLQKYLTVSEELPEDKADALYILGGSTTSTERHIKKAVALYHQHKTDRILIFDSKAKCDYYPLLKRNLTRNEWVIKKLTTGGIPEDQIDIAPVKEIFFGTLSEARDVSRYLRAKKYKSVILLSSPCHSRRISETFCHYLKNSNIQMHIATSNDPFSFSETILEFIKVHVYRVIIITAAI